MTLTPSQRALWVTSLIDDCLAECDGDTAAALAAAEILADVLPIPDAPTAAEQELMGDLLKQLDVALSVQHASNSVALSQVEEQKRARPALLYGATAPCPSPPAVTEVGRGVFGKEVTDESLLLAGGGPATMGALDTAKEPAGRRLAKGKAQSGKVRRRTLPTSLRVKKGWWPIHYGQKRQ
jgi:hypothetical protein